METKYQPSQIVVTHMPKRTPISEFLRWVGQKQVEVALAQEKVTQEVALAIGEGGQVNVIIVTKKV